MQHLACHPCLIRSAKYPMACWTTSGILASIRLIFAFFRFTRRRVSFSFRRKSFRWKGSSAGYKVLLYNWKPSNPDHNCLCHNCDNMCEDIEFYNLRSLPWVWYNILSCETIDRKKKPLNTCIREDWSEF